MVVLIAFFIFASVLFYLGNKIAGIPLISRTLEKYERVIVPIVFIALGIFIMLESGTIAKIMEWIAG
jgi:cadmium resistance protein CadD (predicted permease)